MSRVHERMGLGMSPAPRCGFTSVLELTRFNRGKNVAEGEAS
jgi:hypothetical protein